MLGPAPSLDTLAQTGLLNHSHISEHDGGPGNPPPHLLPTHTDTHKAVAHSHDFAQTSCRSGITSTQHSVNIHWEPVSPVHGGSSLSSSFGAPALCAPTSHLVTLKMKGVWCQGASQPLLSIIHALFYTHFYSGSQRGWSHFQLMSVHESFLRRRRRKTCRNGGFLLFTTSGWTFY